MFPTKAARGDTILFRQSGGNAEASEIRSDRARRNSVREYRCRNQVRKRGSGRRHKNGYPLWGSKNTSASDQLEIITLGTHTSRLSAAHDGSAHSGSHRCPSSAFFLPSCGTSTRTVPSSFLRSSPSGISSWCSGGTSSDPSFTKPTVFSGFCYRRHGKTGDRASCS